MIQKIFIISVMAITILCIQPDVRAQEYSEDAYLESMMFGDIPDVFSALKISQNMMKAPASITVFSDKDIRISGARTIGELLKYVPGLYVTNSRSGFDLLKVRGSQDRYNKLVLLIIDGIPRRELFYGYTSISELVPVENIAQLEIIRGPGSALYGTNAYTSVISIFTKTADSSDKVKLDAGYGEFNSHRFNLGVGKVIGENTDLALNARYLGTDGYEVDRGREGDLSTETTDKNGYNLDVKLNYKDFTFIASHSSLDYSYPWSRDRRTKDRQEENTAYGIQYRGDISDKTGVKVNLYHNGFAFQEDQTKYNPDGSVDEISKSIQDNSILGGDTHLVYQFSANHQVVCGVAFEQEITGQNEEMERAPGDPFEVVEWIQNENGERDFSLTNYALYLQDIWKVNAQLELTLGIRFDKYEQFGSSMNPRVGAVYTPIKNMTLKALYGEAFRGPTFKEFFLTDEDGPAGRSNPSLDAEKIKTAEVEASYAFNDYLLAKIRYFHNKNEDSIISAGDGIPYENVGGIKTDGTEVELEYSKNKLSGFVNFTFTNGEKSDGSSLDGYPDYQINSVLNYSPTEKIDTRIGVRFISDRNRPFDYHDDLSPPLNAVDNLGSYFDVELSLIYQLNNNWSIAGYVYNLFDDENYNPSYDPGAYWDILHAGRAYFLNLTFRLPN